MIWRGDGTNRVCKSLLVLFDQVDAHYPGRDTSNDGTIGNAAHQARKSDHNPDDRGIVRALDITHDPAHGFNSYQFADYLREHWDDRVHYLISNSRIANVDAIDGAPPKAWRHYGGDGKDPHDHHVHISARGDAQADDDRQWDIGAFLGTGSTAPPTAVGPLDQKTIDAIVAAASASDLAHHSWHNGRAPLGYVQGLAVTYGQVLRRLAAGDSVSHSMVRIVNGKPDVFDHYAPQLIAAGMPTANATNVDRLRALWVILAGLGMRESSGGDDIGRDKSADNVSADTAEAGTWQQSRDSFAASGDPELPKLFAAYVGSKPDAVDAIFKKGVKHPSGAFENFGDPESDGYRFQELLKIRPSIAALFAAIGMRTDYPHWGPLNTRAAEIVPAADALFRQVQEIVSATHATQGVPHVNEPIEQSDPSPAGPMPNLPAVPASFDIASLIKHIETFGPRAKRDILMGVSVYNLVWPKDQIVVADGSQPAQPSPAPDAAPPALQRPSVILGTLGTVVSAILAHPKVGAIGMDTGVLSGILSAGTAALGLTGGWGAVAAGALKLAGPLIGKVADKAVARLAANKAQQK